MGNVDRCSDVGCADNKQEAVTPRTVNLGIYGRSVLLADGVKLQGRIEKPLTQISTIKIATMATAKYLLRYNLVL